MKTPGMKEFFERLQQWSESDRAGRLSIKAAIQQRFGARKAVMFTDMSGCVRPPRCRWPPPHAIDVYLGDQLLP